MTDSDAPEISVVLAQRGDGEAIQHCISALRDDAVRTEIIVVHRRPWPSAPEGVRLVACASEDVAAMRAAGIAAAAAPLVALTRDDAQPAAGWLGHFVAGHAYGDAAAIGGPVLVAPGAGPVAVAAWLTEYARFASNRRDEGAEDLAATNVCYRRDALPMEQIGRDGFREQAVHAALRATGRRLRYDPAVPVFLDQRVRAMPFARERFRESRRFARDRAASATPHARLALRLGSFALPLVFTARTLARALRSGRGIEALRALPCVVLFHSAAAAGEIAGYWSPPGRSG